MKHRLFRKRPKRIILQGDKVRSVSYVPETAVLTVWSRRNEKTICQHVPRSVYDMLVASEDPDFYYSTYIHETKPAKSALMRWIVVFALLLAMGTVWTAERFWI